VSYLLDSTRLFFPHTLCPCARPVSSPSILYIPFRPSLGTHLLPTTEPLLVPTNLITFCLLSPSLRPSLKLTTDPLLVPTNLVTFWFLRLSLRPSLRTHPPSTSSTLEPWYLHHADPSDDVPLETRLCSEDVALNGTLTTPRCIGRCVIGTPLPRSSPHPCNVTGVSRGRIPITVHLMRLHELGPLRTRSTLVYL
jgi:hypothetical protein